MGDYISALYNVELDFNGLNSFSEQQSEWAVSAAGVTKRNALKRNATADCLDAFRSRHLIN